MNRRMICTILIIIILIPFLTLTVFANSPPSNTVNPGKLTGADLGMYIFLAICGLVFTVIIEVAVAGMLRKYGHFGELVAKTNILSQVLMHCINLLLNPILYQYAFLLLVILESLVYVTEFFVYRHKMQGVPLKSIWIYTVMANTLSLLAGVAMICYLNF